MPKGLQQWVKRLSANEMPVLGKVVKELNDLTGQEETEISQLASVILQDPHLTSQVLRIANTVRYNPHDQEINTVTRAIVLIGFTGVRAICISLMVIESLLGKKPRQHLLSQMASAFHGATQARAFTSHLGHEEREEVFVATLLYNLGEMAFWAYGGADADKLDVDIDSSSDTKALIMERLGTSFKELSKELGKTWHLGNVLQEALSNQPSVSKKAQAVRLGEAVARVPAEKWVSSEMDCILQKVVKFTGLSYLDARALVDKMAEEAASVALSYGVPEVCQLIPNPNSAVVHTPKEEKETIKILQADAKLQLKLLRELTTVVTEQVDVNTIFRMVLEGMHRGIGLERVVLAFFRKTQLSAKYILGQGAEGWRENFNFDLDSPEPTIFSYASNRREPVWLGQKETMWDANMFTSKVKKLTQRRPLFIGVLRVNNRNAALVYADRGLTEEPLTKEHFESFCHFISQAQFSLQTLATRKP